jgi:hypothetical protein
MLGRDWSSTFLGNPFLIHELYAMGMSVLLSLASLLVDADYLITLQFLINLLAWPFWCLSFTLASCFTDCNKKPCHKFWGGSVSKNRYNSGYLLMIIHSTKLFFQWKHMRVIKTMISLSTVLQWFCAWSIFSWLMIQFFFLLCSVISYHTACIYCTRKNFGKKTCDQAQQVYTQWTHART